MGIGSCLVEVVDSRLMERRERFIPSESTLSIRVRVELVLKFINYVRKLSNAEQFYTVPVLDIE